MTGLLSMFQILRLKIVWKDSRRYIKKSTLGCLHSNVPCWHRQLTTVLLRAFGSIGWLEGESKSKWNLIDAEGVKIDLENYIDDLKDFVSKSANVLLGKCKKHKTGKSSKDNYAGLDRKEWYH